MLAVLQRVSSSSVTVEGKICGEISEGLTILLGVLHDDNTEDIKKLVTKIINLRIFSDENEKMNRSLLDIEGSLLIISQFTLAANCKKGRRPSFDNSANPLTANKYYEEFIQHCKKEVLNVQTGVFGAKMNVKIENDGPVTIILDSNEL